jgi:adenylate cyclase
MQLAELCGRIARCADLDALLGTTLDGLDQLLGYAHVHLLLLAEDGDRLYTIASRGFDADSVGAEVVLGDGVIGMAAQRGAPVRVGSLLQMGKYGRSVRRSFEDQGEVGPGHEVPMPGLPGAESRIAVPAMAGGQLLGVVAADRTAQVAFDERDEATLLVVATVLANAVEALRVDQPDAPAEPVTGPVTAAPPATAPVRVRFFDADGSVFLDGDYLIKGVAGRILWSLLGAYTAEDRVDFTNRELRLDPSLEMPGFKDNLESRLILLKRRLEERDAPIRMQRTGRGRFRLDVQASVQLESG